MSKILDFIKEKSYFLLAGTVLLIIILVIISSCSSNKKTSYEEIESDMISAAEDYYSSRENLLPKQSGGHVKVSLSTLIDLELIDEVFDPKRKSQTCSGYVEVTKVDLEYSYTPILTCAGTYEPKYLTDIIKETSLDEYGNGLYEMDGEYIYRGDFVNNYVSFNDLIWRIVKIDTNGDVKLVLAEKTQETYAWDLSYNIEKNSNTGINNNYLISNIRKVLNNYYQETFTDDSKAKIVSKDICVGRYSMTENFSSEKDCAVIKESEKIGLLNTVDFKIASLDANCINVEDRVCTNRNYLSDSSIRTWLLNSSSENTYKVFYLSGHISEINANNAKRINPVIYLSGNSIISSGNGTLQEPYLVKK